MKTSKPNAQPFKLSQLKTFIRVSKINMFDSKSHGNVQTPHPLILAVLLSAIWVLSACGAVIDPIALEPSVTPTIDRSEADSTPVPPPDTSESSLPASETPPDEVAEPAQQPTEEDEPVSDEPARMPEEKCHEPVGIEKLAGLLETYSFVPICELVREEWGEDEWVYQTGYRWEDPLRGNVVSFSERRGEILAVGSIRGRIRILNTETGSIQEMNSPLGNESQVSDLAFTSNGRFLVSAGLDQLMHKWTFAASTLEAGPKQLSLGARITALDLSIQNFAALGLDTGDLVTVDLASMEIVGRERHVHGSEAQIWDISYNVPGRHIATVGSNNYSYLFETDAGGPFKNPGRRPFSWFVSTPVGFVTAVQSFKSDGVDRYAIGTPDGKVHIYMIERDEPALSSESFGASIWSLDVSPNGELIAVGTDSGHVLILNSKDLRVDEDSQFFFATGYSELKLSAYVISLSFSLDGRFLAVGHAKGISILGVFD